MTTTAPTAAGGDVQWLKCPACEAFVYRKRLERNLRVCPECSHHFRLPARDRLAQLLDEGSFTELSVGIVAVDALGFVDSKPYPARLADSQRKTGNSEAAICGTGTIGGNPLVVAIMDFAFMGGSMGSVVGEKIARLAQRSLEKKFPLIIISASGGARMQEGVLSLMQMAKTAAVLSQLHDRAIPYVSILTNPTTGGVSASFAMLGDAILAEPGAVIGFAGPRVIRQTLGQDLPEGFQTAEFLLDRGMVDHVCHRHLLKETVGRLLRHMSLKPVATGWTTT